MLQRIFLAVLATTAVLSDVAAEEEKFIVTPPNITYAAIGSDVLLNWTYTAPAGVTPLITNWYQADAAGNKDGKYIMSLVSGGNPLVQKESFIGRAEYRPNAGLFIKNISLTDESYMVCSVQFSNGHDHKDQRFLQVTIAPSVTNLFQPEIIVMVDTISVLSCRFEARPVPAVKWLLNDVEMKDSRYNINTTIVGIFQSSYHVVSILTINVTQPEDMGKIQCVGLLPNGNVNSSTDHIVYYAPRGTNFTTNYASNIGELGLVTIFTCKANGNPTISYELYKEGTLLLNSTTGVFKINSTATTDKGKYSCNPVNYLGAGPRMAINFTVHVSPRLQTYSGSAIKTLLDTSLTLYCTYYGEPTPNINWTKTGGLVSSSATISVSVISKNSSFAVVNSTLQFAKVKKSDFGTYNCFAQNSVGSLSKNISVDVQYPPELTHNFGHQQNLTESSVIVRFTCTVESHPISMIHWYKDGLRYTMNINETIKVSTDIKSIIESSLVFPSGINRTDFGIYTCNASNERGNASFATDVTVWYGPEFRSNLTGQLDIMELKNASFECTIEGYPVPVIEWHKNGKKLMHGKYQTTATTVVSTANRIVKKSVISFVKVVENDTAEYTCKGSNVVGMKMQKNRLNVLFLPKLLVPSSNVTANQSNLVNLHCLTNANPPVSKYNWTKDGASLPETGSTYSIASAQHLSTGTYACTPINSLGSSGTLVFKLVVNIPPSFTQQADCKPNRVTKKMVCQCSGTGVPPPSVFWTKQPNTTVIGTGNMYDRDLISKDVDGKYNCHLKNLLKEVISTTGFYHYVNPTTEWASWEACNETCGQGYEFRSRTCNFPPCDEHLVENRTCNVPCTPQKMKQDEAWAIALYVLIPILVVFLAIILLWFARTKKRKDEQTPIVVPVNGNLSKPPSTRSIQTRRNIYLPENTFATMNPGYLEEEKETPRGDDVYIDLETKNYDSIEAELKFDEEYPVDSSTDDITENPTSARSSLDEDVKPTVPDLLINGQIESKEQALELEQQADDEVDTYLGPDNTEVPYSFYNEMSTSL